MSLGAVLLGVLSSGPAHGYDLKRAHDERFPGSRPLAYGQVYASLGRLQRDGFVEVLSTEQDAGPSRTVYALTEAGAEELRAWLEMLEEPSSYAADELVRKTVTALHADLGAADYLERQRTAHMQALRGLVRARADTSAVGSQVALDHAIAHLDADLRWMEQSRERVRAASHAAPTTTPTTTPAARPPAGPTAAPVPSPADDHEEPT